MNTEKHARPAPGETTRMMSRAIWIAMLLIAGGVLSVVAPIGVLAEAGGNARATAVFSGGCFWGVDGVFKHVHGVSKVVSGYTGGAADTANYESVATGT